MRRREISPAFWTDDRIVEVSDAGKLLFIGLLGLADREGRLQDKPKTIGYQVRPWDPNATACLLDELAATGLITRYEVQASKLILIPKFKDHQHPHHKESESKLPGPLENIEHLPRSVLAPTQARSNPAGSMVVTGSSGSSVVTVADQASRQAELPDPPPKFAIVVTPPDTNPENWTGEEFWRWAQDARQRAGLLAERTKPVGLGSWYSSALMTPGMTVYGLQEGFLNFGDDKYWQKANPPLPFQAFKKNWDRYASKGSANVAR